MSSETSVGGETVVNRCINYTGDSSYLLTLIFDVEAGERLDILYANTTDLNLTFHMNINLLYLSLCVSDVIAIICKKVLIMRFSGFTPSWIPNSL